jgi:hypothetical protein
LVRSIIAFFHLLDVDDPDGFCYVEKDPIASGAQSIVVFVIRQFLDLFCMRQVGKGGDRVLDFLACVAVPYLSQLPESLVFPINGIHK